ncbi:MAG: PQQ-dependent sugar dehydrogenase [Chloroflexota bacterium]
MKRVLVVVAVLVLVAAIAWVVSVSGRANPPAGVSSQPGESVVALAEGLEIPWALAFLPDGDIIVTERPGRVRLVDASEGLREEPLLELPHVQHRGEGGLLGIALHPDFPDSPYVYLYYTYDGPGGTANRVSRFPWDDFTVTREEVLIENIPGGRVHNGGRIKFGPDGMLYVTTGDSGTTSLAQEVDSLAGKILRLTPDGTVPADNPFGGSPVYSFGHRNPQGLAWDGNGRLWATEHGSSATDELNLIQPGHNYGWPEIRGDETGQDMETPVLNSGSDTWAPSGMAFMDGSLYFAGLRGSSLYEIQLDGEPSLTRHLAGEFGRLRAVAAGPDGNLFILTSNRDGRGTFVQEDDRLVRIYPDAL